MKAYKVIVILYEGDPVYLETFSTREKACAYCDEVEQDWEGSNVDYLLIQEIEIK